MAEKTKGRGSGAKSRQDKSRTPVRAQPRQSKKSSPKIPARTSSRTALSPGEDGGRSPELLEPLDAGPILNDLLDRVMTECALAAAARQRVPFTVSRARDAVLFVAEWRFLVRDDGDPDPAGDPDPERDGIWSEDEEPQTCPWDSWTPGVSPVVDVPLRLGQVPSEELSETAEAGGLSVCPDGVLDTGPVPDVPLPPSQVPAAEPPGQELPAAAAAPPAQVPVVVTAQPVPEPPCPELPTAPRPHRREPGLARTPRREPRLPRPPAPLPAKPSEPPAERPRGTRGATAETGGPVPPPAASPRASLGSIQQRRASLGTGVPRLGARRGATRWVLPEVKVVDVQTEPERARPGASRARQPQPRPPQVFPGPPRLSKAEPQLCDPWLASVPLSPGVTVRWGSSERRGPSPAGHGRQEDGEQREDEAVRAAEGELKPILPFPECRLSEHGE